MSWIGDEPSQLSRCGRGWNSPDPTRTRPMRMRPGAPYPQGATWDGAGVTFALFSEHATAVDHPVLCGGDEVARTHTCQWEVSPGAQTFRAGDQYPLQGRSLAVLRPRRRRRRP